MSNPTEWIAVDWGTSNLRIWAIDGHGNPHEHRSSDKGMSGLRSEDFEPALLELISDFLHADTVTPVWICGMAGAAEGWAEAGYLGTPCAPPTAQQAISANAQDPRISVRILPGIKQSGPPDVMRGEEVQIAGFLSMRPDFNGVICLPGTHTKWVRIEAGQIIDFQTFMTGELFALLAGSSVLRHIVSADGWDEDAFAKALASPEIPVAQLFSLRAEALIADLSPDAARARLSGHLIGAELSAARPYWENQKIIIVGEETVARLYRTALEQKNIAVEMASADALTLAGLKAAFKETT